MTTTTTKRRRRQSGATGVTIGGNDGVEDEDDEKMLLSQQRERVTYAPTTTARKRRSETNDDDDDESNKKDGSTTNGSSGGRDSEKTEAAMRRLFQMGDGTTGTDVGAAMTAGGGGARKKSEPTSGDGLTDWLSDARGVASTTRNGEAGSSRPSIPVAPTWNGQGEDAGGKSPGGRRRRRRSDDAGEVFELLTNLEDSLHHPKDDDGERCEDAAMDTTTTTTNNVEPSIAVNTAVGSAVVQEEIEWMDDEDDSQAMLDAVALAEKNKANSAQTTQASAVVVPRVDDMDVGTDEDDDDDLLAAVQIAERRRATNETVAGAILPAHTGGEGAQTGSLRPRQTETGAAVDEAAEAAKAEALAIEKEERRAESEILGTWDVVSVLRNRFGHVEEMRLSRESGETKTVRLHDEWQETPVNEGDSVRLHCVPNVVNESDVRDASVVDVTREGGVLIILYPSYLIAATTIGGSFQCSRITAVASHTQVIWGDATANEPALVGTIMHELTEAALMTAAGRNSVPMEVTIERMIKSMTAALYEVNMPEKELKKRIDETMPGVQRWANRLLALSRVPKVPRATPGANPLARMNRIAATEKLRAKCTVGVEAEVRHGAAPQATLQVDDIVDIEELIWAPKLGLKGVLDGVANAALRHREGEVPTTSLVPIELKTGKWKGVFEHGAQVLLYTLMISERYGTLSPWGVLHYTTGGDEGESRILQATVKELSFLVLQRNRLVAALRPTISEADKNNAPAQHGDARYGLAQLPKMNPTSWCERCFQRDFCFTLHRVLENGNGETSELGELFDRATEHIKKEHEPSLRRWIKLIDLESAELLNKRATPWLPVELVNRRDGFALDGLRLLKEVTEDLSLGDDRYYYTFEVPTTAHDAIKKITIADRVVLSVDGGVTTISRAQIIEVKKQEGNTVQLLMSTDRALRLVNPEDKNEPQVGSVEPNTLWRIDKDGAALTMAARSRGNVLTLYSLNSEHMNKIRARIVDLVRPKFEPLGNDKATIDAALKSIPVPLNCEQLSAVEKIVSCEDYALILGLPGAGKTATLVAAVKALRALGKSVLITSHTHSAIDNILSRLPEVGVQEFVRVGDPTKIAPAVKEYRLGSERWYYSVTDDLRKISERAPVAGVTCYGVNNPFFQRKQFDVVLVDEAGQITFPAILPPLFMAKKFVLVGDHHQLPPLVVSKDAAEGGLSKSLFASLCAAHPDAVTDLALQYRMAEPLTRLPNVLTYGGKLRAGTEEVAKQTLVLDDAPDFLVNPPQWLNNVMDPEKHVVFLDTSPLGAAAYETKLPLTNESEMTFVLSVLGSFIARGIDADDMCALSPFNAQVDAIESALGKFASLKKVESLTIDRAQGRDMKAVCISFVRSNEQHVAGELLNDRRRLNVALTRAKKKLVLIGAIDTLRSSPALADAHELLKREGWITPVTNESLDHAKRLLEKY